jgi:P22 coat protein - gene protein 5
MAIITQAIADSSGFVPVAWALRAIDTLRANIVLLPFVSQDVNFEEKGWLGKTLNIGYPGTLTAQKMGSGGSVNYQTPTNNATIPVPLSNHVVVPINVEDYANATSNMELLDRYLNPAIKAVAEQVETDLFALIAGLTTAPLGVAGTNITNTIITSAKVILDGQLAPKTDRGLFVSSKDEAAILGDSTLTQWLAYDQGRAIAEGRAPRLMGFDFGMSQLTPTNTGNAVQTVTVTGAPTGGTFTLTFSGQTTAGIAYNATAAAVQTALQALSTIGTNNATVSGASGGPYTVTFQNALYANTTALTASGAGLTGGTSPGVTIAQAGTVATRCAALHKESLIFASRQFRDIPEGAGVATATVIDEVTGLAIRVLKQYSIDTLSEKMVLDVLYGCANLRPGVGVLINT